MNPEDQDDLSNYSMLELFRVEVESQKTLLTDGLLALESDPTDDEKLEGLMRAAHSIKGAARIVNLNVAVEVAHKMEDAFEAIRRDPTPLAAGSLDTQLADLDLSEGLKLQTTMRGLLTDIMLAGVDLLTQIATTREAEIGNWSTAGRHEIDRFLADVTTYLQLHESPAEVAAAPAVPTPDADLAGMSMLDLFKVEVENQKTALTDRLLSLENDPTNPETLEALMRAAHSVKGAARIVNLDVAVKVAHAMEDAFEAIRKTPENVAICSVEDLAAYDGLAEKYQTETTFVNLLVDIMLDGVDLLWRIGTSPESAVEKWQQGSADEISGYLNQLNILLQVFTGKTPTKQQGPRKAVDEPRPQTETSAAETRVDTFLRVTANNLNRILALAGESQIETQRLRPFSENLSRIKRQLADLNFALDNLRDTLATEHMSDDARGRLGDVRDRVSGCRRALNEQLADLESIGRRHLKVSNRLYDAAIACRMRPFADGIQGFRRMVRDVSRQLGKKVKLEIIGEETQVDRDILERLEANITQLLRNAIDHGVESPAERKAAGKPETCTITLEARHSSGKLLVSVADDGRGIEYETLRTAVVSKGLTTAGTADKLSESELLEFLFLPGFSQREKVTEISGRGVGLDIVYNMVKSVRGTVRVYTEPGKGTRFEMQLPLTLSVLRSLLVEVNGQPYAFPLAEIQRTIKIPEDQVSRTTTLPTAVIDENTVELIPVARIFDEPTRDSNDVHNIIVMGERDQHYGLVVDAFLGERELVVQPLDPRLGKIQDVSAGALMDNGHPVLIVDAQDIIRGADRICRGETVFLSKAQAAEMDNSRPRILVADDSLTVREMERQLLTEAGYEVTVAVDGVDAWNSLRAAPSPFHLVVTDMDMPRMSGVELCELIRADTSLGDLPVIMITYKDREEDRRRAISAGVNLYLTKGSFQDDTFLEGIKRLL